jgi:ATP-dependent protease ClpP protease subunit
MRINLRIDSVLYEKISSKINEEIQLRTERLKDVQKKLDTIVTTRTKVKQSVLDDYRSRKAEWYIDSDEAIALGFADKIKK